MDASRKSRVALTACIENSGEAQQQGEGIISIKSALDYNFQDMEGLLRLVKLAMKANNRWKTEKNNEATYLQKLRRGKVIIVKRSLLPCCSGSISVHRRHFRILFGSRNHLYKSKRSSFDRVHPDEVSGRPRKELGIWVFQMLLLFYQRNNSQWQHYNKLLSHLIIQETCMDYTEQPRCNFWYRNFYFSIPWQWQIVPQYQVSNWYINFNIFLFQQALVLSVLTYFECVSADSKLFSFKISHLGYYKENI